MNNRNIKNFFIIGTIIICLIFITVYKYNEEKLLNMGNYEGFEYYTDSNYTVDKDANSGYPIVLILGSSMCKSCENLSVITKKLNKEYQGIVKIKYVDILKNKEIKEKFKPRVTPTMFFADETGELRYFIEGLTTEEKILDYLSKMGVDVDG